MANPRVFISSTCYDLKYIRENLRYFVKTLGYEPILSEDGAVYFNPAEHTHDACINEVPNCQIFVLIIGGRYGGTFKESDSSITNAEYKEAARLKIPVFALVDSAVYNEHHVFLKNKKNKNVDISKLIFPSVDSTKVFDFMDEVRGQVSNNALVPFRDFGDIESYLRQQWAGMMFDFLNKRNEQAQVADTLQEISIMNTKIEMLSKQILNSVGTPDAKIEAFLYEEMLSNEAIQDITFFDIKPKPASVILNDEFEKCLKYYGIELAINDKDTNTISSSGTITNVRMNIDKASYSELRSALLEILKDHGITEGEYLLKHGLLKQSSL
ncbi:DUF4062 domain-containing protein [Undibacterium sp. Tian12W]|uniref:DUF4062 domain-containing protein n=1 Tax=Undibacterium sp. Tian12W TaxID=3413054 RepID=UPI003BF151CE